MDNLPKDLWHHLAEEDVFTALKSDHHEGLSHSEVEERLRLFGPNAITAQKPVQAWKRFLLQFHNPLIYILLVATLVTFFLKEYIDSAVIFGVVIINAIIGYMQEAKAEEAINSLKKCCRPMPQWCVTASAFPFLQPSWYPVILFTWPPVTRYLLIYVCLKTATCRSTSRR